MQRNTLFRIGLVGLIAIMSGTAQAGERDARQQLRGTIVGNPGKASFANWNHVFLAYARGKENRPYARSLVGVPSGIGLTFKKPAAKNGAAQGNRPKARGLVGVPPGIGLTFKKSAPRNNAGHPKAQPSRKSSGKPKPHRS